MIKKKVKSRKGKRIVDILLPETTQTVERFSENSK